MNKDQKRPDSRLNNITERPDASSKKDAGKLIEVKKRDSSEDKNNDFVVHEKPFDEQMHEPFNDLKRDNFSDEEAD